MSGKNNIKYTAADIQKYLEGKLSASEMHAMENAALNDEFLADAIEGIEVYKKNNSGDFNTDVKELKTIVENKRRNKYGPVLWKAASAIAIVATIIALLFNQQKNAKRSEVLATKNIEPKKEEQLKEEELTKPSIILTDTVKEKVDLNTATISKPSSRPVREIPLPATVYFEKEKAVDSSPAVVSPIQPKQAPVEALQGRAAGVVISDKINKRRDTFSGTVKDVKGDPVTGAVVSIKGTNQGTVTDEEGSFKITNTGGDSSLDVLVNSIGFNDAEKKIFSNKNENNIILDPASSAGLDEVVVTGYDGRFRKKQSVPDDNIVAANNNNAKPINGWKDYKKYLEKNKRTDSLWKNDKGKVTVSFQVDSDGVPYNFSIEKSLTPFYDQEAIRLIKEGPRWKLRNSKTAKLSINIDF